MSGVFNVVSAQPAEPSLRLGRQRYHHISSQEFNIGIRLTETSFFISGHWWCHHSFRIFFNLHYPSNNTKMSMTRSTATQKASMEQVLRHPRKLDPHLLGILLLEIRRLDCECRECFVDHSTQSSVQHSHRLYHLTTVFSSEPHTDIQKHPHITADSASPVTWHHM